MASDGSNASSLDASDAAEEAVSAYDEGQPLSANLSESANSDGGGEGAGGRGGETELYPEKSRFNVMFGMLAIATMVDEGGAVPSRTGDGVKTEGMGGAMEEEDVEATQGDGAGVTGRHELRGGQGVVAVLDNSHEMDRCSCDLVKVII